MAVRVPKRMFCPAIGYRLAIGEIESRVLQSCDFWAGRVYLKLVHHKQNWGSTPEHVNMHFARCADSIAECVREKNDSNWNIYLLRKPTRISQGTWNVPGPSDAAMDLAWSYAKGVACLAVYLCSIMFDLSATLWSQGFWSRSSKTCSTWNIFF